MSTQEHSKNDPRQTAKSFALPSVILIIGLAIFLAAYVGIGQKILLGSWDQPLLSWTVQHRQSWLTDIMKLISTIANPVPFTLIVCFTATAWAVVKREIWRPLLLIGAMGLATVLSTILKLLTASARPPHISMIPPLELDYSFPSGHTICAATFLLVIGYLIWSKRPAMSVLASWMAASTLGILLVAVSRLYLGYHWLTDVVASAGLGLAILAVIIAVDRFYAARYASGTKSDPLDSTQ